MKTFIKILGVVVLGILGYHRLKNSKIFLSNLTDDELAYEREEARKSSFGVTDMKEATRLENLLRDYDREMAIRSNAKYDKENPNAPRIHREHGWYLPNDD